MKRTMPNTTTLTEVFQGHEIRVVRHEGSVWLVATDVAQALGFRDAHSMTRSLDEDEKGYAKVCTPGGKQRMTIISESGTYHAIFHSNAGHAKAFRRWVTRELLPAMRENRAIPSGDRAPVASGTMLDVAEQLIGALRQQEQELREQKKELQQIKAEQEQTDYEQEQLRSEVRHMRRTIEEKRERPSSPETRYGHDVAQHTWDGMRRSILAIVSETQRRTRRPFSNIYRQLHDACNLQFGFHGLRLKEQRGASSGLQALNFDEMRAALHVARRLFK
ncbi:hypothetical protein [Salisaeta icosahedral phage 1]|uniref:anti-repressor Ant n=1 Tax=Salisaeta icosahedral phage 1 TaxID=1183239 RepID=UPI00025EA92A|nr:anti-repressor Ant [Salisaeta icosahedral phage 1]AFJ21484.1 hypothetical protein [Salisaeta icosahedral phage 1]